MKDTLTIKALSDCSSDAPGFKFSLYKHQVKTLPAHVAEILIDRGYVELWWDGERWPLKNFTPSSYLKRYPRGPHAELARELLGL